MREVHRESMISQTIGLRSPRPTEARQYDRVTESFSPIPVSETQGVVSMDIGSSPVHPTVYSHGGNSPSGRGSGERDLLNGNVGDTTTQLSDISSEIAATEERLADLEERGSAIAFPAAAAASKLGQVGRYEDHSRSTAAGSGLSPLSDGGEVAPPIATKTFSLVALQKQASRNRPLVSVAIEVVEGVEDHIRLYEGDTYATCREHALELVERHHLDYGLAFDPLVEHLCSTLDEYRPQTSNAGCRPLGSNTVDDAPRDSKGSSSMPSPSASRMAPTRQGRQKIATSPHRGIGVPTATKLQPNAKQPIKHATQGDQNASRQRNQQRSESPETSRPSTSSGHFSHVSARYLSPAPERPHPIPQIFTHTPYVTKKSEAMMHRLNASNAPAHQRLYERVVELEAKRQESLRAQQDNDARERQRSFSNHRVRGLDWDTGSRRQAPPGHRLHDQAVRQQKRLSEKISVAIEERSKRELEGVVFQPKINQDRSVSATRRSEHHDPFYYPGGSSASMAAGSFSSQPKVLSMEERELLQCTFHPKVNTKRTSPRAKHNSNLHEAMNSNRPGDNTPPLRTPHTATTPSTQHRISHSPALSASGAAALGGSVPGDDVHLISPCSNRSAAAQRKVSPLRSSAVDANRRPTLSSVQQRPVSPMRLHGVDPDAVSNRLYQAATDRKKKLEQAKRLAETIDSKTGRPLFTPFVGR